MNDIREHQELQTSESRPILVTGGTGNLGRHVVTILRQWDWDVRVLTRQAPEPWAGVEFVSGDLETGENLRAAVEGAEIIVHLAGTAQRDGEKAERLVDAVSRAGTPHVVSISVVGADRVPVKTFLDRAMFGYYAQKRAAERVVSESGLPWTTLRATQFHDLFLTLGRQMSKLPVIPYPSGFRAQPVHAGEVAERVVALALGPPSGLVPDLGGPRVYEVGDLLRSYLHARGSRRPLLPVRAPGGAAAALRDGANLATDRAVGRVSWEDFLAERIAAPRSHARAVPADVR